MFSYIKRHWPVYVVLFLIAIAMGLGAAYIVGAKGSDAQVHDERRGGARAEFGCRRHFG